MGLVSLVILTITGLCLIFSMLGGFLKGGKRAILRLIIVIAVLVCIVLFREQITAIVFKASYDNKTIEEWVVQAIPEEYLKYKDIVWPIFMILSSMIIFMVGLFVCELLSLIIYYILAIFVKPRKNEYGRVKKHPLIGLLIGAIQGIIIAIAYCNVLTGVTINVEVLEGIELNGKSLIDESTIEVAGKKLGIEEYNNSQVGVLYRKFDSILYKNVSKYKIDDKEYTLDGQIETLKSAVKIANELQDIQNIDFSGGITSENKDSLIEAIKNIGSIVNGSTEEVKESINNIIQVVGDNLNADIDLSNLDITKINFDETANAVESAYKVMDGNLTGDELNQEIDKLVDSAIESNLLPQIAGMTDLKVDIPEDKKEDITSKIDNSSLSESDKEKIKNMFNLKGEK